MVPAPGTYRKWEFSSKLPSKAENKAKNIKMLKLEEIQKRLATTPNRADVKTCLRESHSAARGGNAFLSIKLVLFAIFGLLKIRDLTKPEKNTFNDNISKVLGNIDLIPLVREATEGEESLVNSFEEKGLKDTFTRLQTITNEIKNLEKKAAEKKDLEKKDEVNKFLRAISVELKKGHIAAAKNKADRLLGKYPENKAESLDEIITIFEKHKSLNGWWYYLQKRFNPEECSLEEAKFCAAQIAKIRSLDDPKNTKDWYRNSTDYRLKVWELTPKNDSSEIDSVIEACYNLAICVYYATGKINDKEPKTFGRELIEQGLKVAPDSSHLIKMAKTFGVWFKK
ncbi:hypothetical protein [Maridesulfovibrio sp. FT414]|uniref:hypothetical protein n=1 Tax=Maridesulfovibrio sp. FT414 TaxID=2979469 RepID=UPI003D8077FA